MSDKIINILRKKLISKVNELTRTKAKEHKYCREAFNKFMINFKKKNEEIELYPLFYQGFRTGINYNKRVTKPSTKSKEEY